MASAIAGRFPEAVPLIVARVPVSSHAADGVGRPPSVGVLGEEHLVVVRAGNEATAQFADFRHDCTYVPVSLPIWTPAPVMVLALNEEQREP
jgi:hypothetical protein